MAGATTSGTIPGMGRTGIAALKKKKTKAPQLKIAKPKKEKPLAFPTVMRAAKPKKPKKK